MITLSPFDMAFSLASSNADLGSDEACARHFHELGVRRAHLGPKEWDEMLDQARKLRAEVRVSKPSIAEYAVALLCIGALWFGLIAQGPVS